MTNLGTELSRPSLAAYRAMPRSDRRAFDTARLKALGHLGPYATGAIREIRNGIEDLIADNELRPPNDVPWGAVVTGPSHVGKSRTLRSVGERYRDRRLEQLGPMLGIARHLPWVQTRVTADSTVNGLAETILVDGYNAPLEKKTPSLSRLQLTVEDMVRRCGTGVLVIEDVHQVRPADIDGQRLNKFIKRLAGTTGVTILIDGVDLEEIGFLTEGHAGPTGFTSGRRRQQLRAGPQLGERFQCYRLGHVPFEADRGEEWITLLGAYEQDIVLCVRPPGLTEPGMAAWLHQCTGGKLGRLTPLLRTAARRAILDEASGRFDRPFGKPLLESVKRSWAGEPES